MKTTAIKDLSQLNDNDLVLQVSEGLELIAEHALSIEEDVKLLVHQNRQCGCNILEAVLREEAAKFLILVDAIRCPRVPSDTFSRQLGRFNDHLAKGIYSLVYDFRPGYFAEIREVIQQKCSEYYLDGPNDCDWIFRNEVLQVREENIYVDYIESEGTHAWITPRRYYDPEMFPVTHYIRSGVLEVADSIWRAGLTKPEALLCVANNYRSVSMDDDFSWSTLRDLNMRMLDEVYNAGILANHDGHTISTIVDKWLFPLYGLDMKLIKVDKEQLKEMREEMFHNMYF